MAQQTINVGTAPNDGTGTPLRTAFQYTNSNFSELYTAVGPSGNNIVVPGTATITGDLTVKTNVLKVDTTNNRVGVGNSIPAVGFDVGYSESVFGSSTSSGYSILNLIGTGTGSARYGSIRKNYDSPFDLKIRASNSNSDAPIIFELSNASTAMTLNSTGLGVGGSPATKIFASVTPPAAGQDGVRVSDGTRLIQMSISGSTYSYQGIGANQNVIYASGNPLSILSDGQNLRLGTSLNNYLLLDTSGNVGIGVTPSAGKGCLQLSSGINFPATQVASSDANTLDDYEEGTWTGTLKGGTTDPTIPVTATGQYTKIGNQVFVRILFGNVITTGASGAISVTGLPFANGSNRTIGSCLCDLIATFTGSPICWVGGTGTTLNFQASNSNAAASDLTHNAGAGRYFYASITYTV